MLAVGDSDTRYHFMGVVPLPDVTASLAPLLGSLCSTVVAVLAGITFCVVFVRYRLVLTATGIRLPTDLWRSTGMEISYPRIPSRMTEFAPEVLGGRHLASPTAPAAAIRGVSSSPFSFAGPETSTRSRPS